MCPSLRKELFIDGGSDGYSELTISEDNIKTKIFENPEFKTFSHEVDGIINRWEKRHNPLLKSIKKDSNPRKIIFEISEDILKTFESNKLIDKYDIYQHLMNYWLETMKDDVYIIMENGWIGNSELIPEEYIINKYFMNDKQSLFELECKKDEITAEKEEFEEENSGEEGILEDLKNDKDKITKGSVQKRIKEIKDDKEFCGELLILEKYLSLMDEEAKANKAIKDAAKELDRKVEKKYKELSTDEIKTLVVDDKWTVSILADIRAETDRISYKLTSKIKELTDRYEKPLPTLEKEVMEYEAKVKSHLERMGFAW